MKILALSDLHLSKKAADDVLARVEDADVLVIAGDFSQKGKGLSDYLKGFETIQTPAIVVPGNHESLAALDKACNGWASVTLLHGNQHEINGQVFFGLGYEFPRRNFESWNQYLGEADAASILDSCPEDAVLVTHVPPFGIGDKQRNGIHEGSKVLRQFLERRSIKLHLCGHIHYSWGKDGWVNGCRSQNLGPGLNWFEI